MRVLWCWRCCQEVAMLDEDEYRVLHQVYGECIRSASQRRNEHFARTGERLTIHDLFEPVRQAYTDMTSVADCHHNTIMHHRIALYGPPCSVCGKPLRTPQAQFCAACGAALSERRLE